ncbi:MAG TPA: hypothetical protein DEP19_05050, partial [Anaerolineae bacterium]|nr:hypothetical protein [Anaerolineae bacterium]
EDGMNFEKTSHAEIFRMMDEEKVDSDSFANVLNQLADFSLHSQRGDLIQTLNSFLPSGSVGK